MRRKIAWLALSCLIVTAILLSSCGKNNDNNNKHDDSTDVNHNIDNSHIDDIVDNHTYLYHERDYHGNHRHHNGHNQSRLTNRSDLRRDINIVHQFGQPGPDRVGSHVHFGSRFRSPLGQPLHGMAAYRRYREIRPWAGRGRVICVQPLRRRPRV